MVGILHGCCGTSGGESTVLKVNSKSDPMGQLSSEKWREEEFHVFSACGKECDVQIQSQAHQYKQKWLEQTLPQQSLSPCVGRIVQIVH